MSKTESKIENKIESKLRNKIENKIERKMPAKIQNKASDESKNKLGKITLVATPIGNLGDISRRALDSLASADLVAAEDTRHSGNLLHNFGIKKPMVSYYQHNEKGREQELLAALARGEEVALISDAGTPGICDPGSAILQAAVAAGFLVDAIPGACAMIQALVLSGLSTEKFVFEGFVPRGSALKPYLEKLAAEERTLVFYEAPHRLKDTLKAFLAVFGEERQVAVCRELTKKFQEVNRGNLAEINAIWQDREVLGEFVLVVAGAKLVEKTVDLAEVAAHLQRLLAGGMKHKAAAKEVAAIYDLSVSEVYQMGVNLKEE